MLRCFQIDVVNRRLSLTKREATPGDALTPGGCRGPNTRTPGKHLEQGRVQSDMKKQHESDFSFRSRLRGACGSE